MYAVIKTGGKQYRVVAGEKLKVEKLEGEVGSKVIIDQVLMLADGDDVTIGAPVVKGASVSATVVAQGRATTHAELLPHGGMIVALLFRS